MNKMENSIAPGVYKDLDIDKYHSDPALGSSGLKLFSECPYLYYHRYILGRRSTTGSLDFGKEAHEFILEPNKNKYIVFEGDLRTKNGKAEWEEKNCIAKEIGGKIVRAEELRQLQGMAERIFNHKYASALFRVGGDLEVSYFAMINDIMMKARPDRILYIKNLGNCIIDYKTTSSSLNIRSQSNDAFKYGRPIQAAFHSKVYEAATGQKIDNIFYVCQMKEEPWLVRVVRMTPEQVDLGNEDIEAILPAFKYCKELNIWPDYGDDLEDLITPGWYDYRKLECNSLINFN